MNLFDEPYFKLHTENLSREQAAVFCLAMAWRYACIKDMKIFSATAYVAYEKNLELITNEVLNGTSNTGFLKKRANILDDLIPNPEAPSTSFVFMGSHAIAALIYTIDAMASKEKGFDAALQSFDGAAAVAEFFEEKENGKSFDYIVERESSRQKRDIVDVISGNLREVIERSKTERVFEKEEVNLFLSYQNEGSHSQKSTPPHKLH